MAEIYDAIKSRIETALTPSFFQLENESHNHNVPANSETHFKLTIVADSFDGVSPVKRHQRVYQLLEQEIKNGVHALALHLYTPAQWQKRNAPSPASPQCMGGEKG